MQMVYGSRTHVFCRLLYYHLLGDRMGLFFVYFELMFFIAVFTYIFFVIYRLRNKVSMEQQIADIKLRFFYKYISRITYTFNFDYWSNRENFTKTAFTRNTR